MRKVIRDKEWNKLHKRIHDLPEYNLVLKGLRRLLRKERINKIYKK